MTFFKKNNLKYKLLSFDELVIDLDRLTRFKTPDVSYYRVFSSVLDKCLISPKYSKSQIEKLPAKLISDYVKIIWNASVSALFPDYIDNPEVNKTIKLLIKMQYKNTDENVKTLINTKIAISPILKKLDYDSAPGNLKILIHADKVFSENNTVSSQKLIELREKFLLKFPVQTLLIVEGITEENLLPVFADKLKHNFDKEGIYVLGAGGKSKSPDLYVQLKDKLKIPIVILFDNDAKEICDVLKQTLLKKDKTIIIKDGEFEDILSLNLLKRALNNEYENSNLILKSDLKLYDRMCRNLEYFYRTKKLGEFKKSKFSKIIASNVRYNTDITQEIKRIINEIVVCNKKET